jgi:hypothetical protein
LLFVNNNSICGTEGMRMRLAMTLKEGIVEQLCVRSGSTMFSRTYASMMLARVRFQPCCPEPIEIGALYAEGSWQFTTSAQCEMASTLRCNPLIRKMTLACVWFDLAFSCDTSVKHNLAMASELCPIELPQHQRFK